MYEIVFYETARGKSPVEEFLEEFPRKHQRKIAGILELLREEGPNLRRPYADQVRGPLRELRVQFGRNEYRIFHFFVTKDDRVVLVHGFKKKTQKLPVREIETAETRMADYLRRDAAGEFEA